MTSIDTEWVKDLFTFRELGQDYALAAGKRARKDISDQCKTAADKDAMGKTLELMRSRDGLRRLKRKKLRNQYVEPKSTRKNDIWQCRWKGNKAGRIWFIMKDEEPGAIAPTVAIQGCELQQHDRNSDRIKSIADRLKFPNKGELYEVIEESLDEDIIASEGKSIELESDYDIRPLIPGTFDAMMDFCEKQMGIRPTNDQLDTILHANTPLFINGQAGTGKTVMLSLRAALRHLASILESLSIDVENDACSPEEEWKPRRTLVTSISENVVDLLEENMGECLREVFRKEKIGAPSEKIGAQILSEAIDAFDLSIQEGNKETWTTSSDIRNFICFRTFKQIQIDLLPKDKREKFDDNTRNVKFSLFSNGFFASRSYDQLSVELAWFGIRAIIRGMCARVTTWTPSGQQGRYLEKEDIRQLMEESPQMMKDFSKSEVVVKSLLKCHEDYRKWLDKNDFYDDMDLARETWRTLEQREKEEPESSHRLDPFHEIYLDEAQDLTDLELRILLKLLKPSPNSDDVIMAGDPLQTINPSGFSWDTLKSIIYDTVKTVTEEQAAHAKPEDHHRWINKLEKIRPPEPMNLSVNYRTPSNIVDLGNVILQKRTHYQKEQSSEQSSTVQDGKLELFVISDQHSDQITNLMKQDAQRFTISRDSDRDGVKRLVEDDDLIAADPEDTRIYSITQVKGLEETEVILYRMGEGLLDADVNKILTGAERDTLSGDEKLKVGYELNKLYIGLTRARRKMLLLEHANTAERLWQSDWFSRSEIKVIEDSDDVAKHLVNVWEIADENTDPKELALRHFERFKQDPDPIWIEWALSNALKAPDFSKRKLAEIRAMKSMASARDLTGPERTKEYLDAAGYYIDGGFPKEDYAIYLDHLMKTSSGPKKAYDILCDRPGVSRPTGNPENDRESRFLRLMNSGGNKKNIDAHLSDLGKPQNWYDIQPHAEMLSVGLKVLLADEIKGGDPELEGHTLKIVESNILTKAINEQWFKELLPILGVENMWKSLTEGPLSVHVPESPALGKSLGRSADQILDNPSTELRRRLEIREKWAELNPSNMLNLAEASIHDMLETEFDSLTPPQLTETKDCPFVLSQEEHIHYLDWAERVGFTASGRAVSILRHIGSSEWIDGPKLNVGKMKGLWECTQTGPTSLDSLTDSLSEFTDTKHLNKHVSIVVERWIEGVSGLRDPRAPRFHALSKTSVWADCCSDREAMEAILGFLPKNDATGFCNTTLPWYKNQQSEQSGEGWVEFESTFIRQSKTVLRGDTPLSKQLRKELCLKGAISTVSGKSSHENNKLYAKAYNIYVKENAQVRPDEAREALEIFRSLGETNSDIIDGLGKLIPPDLSKDIPAIIEEEIEAVKKIDRILDTLLSVQGVNQGELKKSFEDYVLRDINLRAPLLLYFDNLRDKLEEFANNISILTSDDPILVQLQYPFFQFLSLIYSGELELEVLRHEHKTLIRAEIEKMRMELLDVNSVEYSDATSDLLNVLWWKDGEEKYKSASLIAFFLALENRDTNSAGYMTIKRLVELRMSLGQEPNPRDPRPVHIRALLDIYEGDQLYQNSPNLDAARSRLCE